MRSFNLLPNLLKTDILHFYWLLGAKTTSRQITHSKWCFWECFRIQTKCIPINVTKISILYLLFFALNVNKGCAPAFCNFSSTFLKSVEKRFLAYIYICLFLYLPICLLPTIILDLVYLPIFISAIIECLNQLLP